MNRLYSLLICLLALGICAQASPDPEGINQAQWDAFLTQGKKAQQESQAKRIQDQLKSLKAELSKIDAGDPERVRIVRAINTLGLPEPQAMEIWGELLDDVDDRVQERALYYLSRHKQSATEYSPRVLELLGSDRARPYVRIAAAIALGSIAKTDDAIAIQSLLSFLIQPGNSDEERLAAIRALGLVGPTASSAAEAIQAELDNRVGKIQVAAYAAIGLINKPEPYDLDTIGFRLLSQTDSYTTFLAIQNTAPEVQERIAPIIVSVLDASPPYYLKRMCVETLGRIGYYEPKAVSHMLAAGSPTSNLALDSLDSTDTRAIPPLINGLRSDRPLVRIRSARSLSKFGNEAQDAVELVLPRLSNAGKDSDLSELGAYLQLIRAIGPEAEAVSDTLIKWLPETSSIYHDRDRFLIGYFRAYVLETLSHTGIPPNTMPYIIDGLVNSDADMMHLYVASARAAGALGPEAEAAIPGLLRSLEYGFVIDFVTFTNYQERLSRDGIYTTPQVESVRALAMIGSAAEAALPRLREIADGKPLSPYEYSDSRQIIPNIQEEAKKAIVAIEEHIDGH